MRYRSEQYIHDLPDFNAGDIDKVLRLHVPWWLRVKYWFLWVIGVDVEPPWFYIITDVKPGFELVISPAFRCKRCRKYIIWDKGCADDLPFHCDDCWALEPGIERGT